MTARFITVSIQLGNAAMDTPLEVADALRRAAHVLEATDADAIAPAAPESVLSALYDDNGNRVGHVAFMR